MKRRYKQFKDIFVSDKFLIPVILLLAFFVRMYKIATPLADWHSWRQSDTAAVSRIYVDEGINLLFPKYYDISRIQTGIFNPEGLRMVEFPFYNVIHAVLASNFSIFSLEIWGRLISIVFAILSTYLLYLLGNRFLGKWGGTLSAFFYAFMPYNIYFTRVILPEPMALFFALFGSWLFVKHLDQESNKFLYLSGIMFAISMLIKPFTFFYLVPLVFLVIQKHKKDLFEAKVLIPLLVFANIALAPFFLWRIWINEFPRGIPYFNWAFNGDDIRFRPAFWRWIFGERLGKLFLGYWGLVLFSFGILRKSKGSFYIRSLLLGLFFYVAIFATASVRHDYYQIFVIPGIALTLASGTKELLSFKYNKFFASGLVLFSVAMMFLVGAQEAREYYKINHMEIVLAGKAADELLPKDARVIAPYNGDTAFLYQTKRYGWPVVDESIDRMIERGADYYVTVNKDNDLANIKQRFMAVEETNAYAIVDLHKKIN